jgi:hypothetical protein
MTFVCLHDEVRVTLVDGTVAQGFSTGADWWGTPEGPQVLMDVEPDGAEIVIFEEGQVATAQPVGGYTQRGRFEHDLAHLITEAAQGASGDSIAMIVSEHVSIEVTVTRHEWGCSPPVRPRWRTGHEPSPA